MDARIVVLSLIFALSPLIWIISLASRRTKKLPPGPIPLPIIGNLHLLGDQPHKSLAKLAKTHGPLMSLKLGTITTIVISSSVVAKEVLQKHDLAFCGRSVPDAVHAHNHSQLSVVWLPAVDSKWRSLRKIINSHIFSVSRLDASQEIRSKKVEDIIGYCKLMSQSGEAVDIGEAAFRTSLNLLSNIIFSRDLTDPFTDSAKEFKDVVWDILADSAKPNIVDVFPVLRKFDPQGLRRRMSNHLDNIFKIFRSLITERLDSKRSGNIHMDVLDELLALCKEAPEDIDITGIEHIFLDLFAAGTDTTSSTLEWAMAELLRNPHILNKAQTELAEVVGRGKQIKETDLPRLPYLQCIVKETFRIHPAVPLLIPHKVERDVELFGYIVPKGSQVLVNSWAIGRDETIWEDPLAFKPERFSGSQVDVKGQDFELIPFGAGRRICPGMSLALRTIPTVLGSLLNMFDWELEGGIEPEALDMAENFGITLQKALPLRAVPIPIASIIFAGSEMDVRGQDFELIPFGAGRRICPGMSLAMRTIPVVLGSLLNIRRCPCELSLLLFLLWVVFPLSLIWISSLASRRGKNLPPGPKPLPIIGNLHLLGQLPHKSLAKLAKVHGPVMSLKLGQVTAVVISSSAAAKEVLQKQDSDFSNRAVPDSLHAQDHVKYSVAWLPNASKWRITLRRIINFYVFSASQLDIWPTLWLIRQKNSKQLCGTSCRKPIQFHSHLPRQAAFTASLNTLSNIFFSEDLTHPSADSAKEFKTVMSDFSAEAGGPNLVDFFPVLRKFDPQGVRRRMTVHFRKVLDIFHALVSQRLENRKSGGTRMDVLDGLLALSEEDPEEIDINLIQRLFLDLLSAGTDTTSSTLEWAMAELLKNPRILQRVQAELAEVVGRGKPIEDSDVARLPYLQCVVKETLRLHPAVPLLLPRTVERDVELFGYSVPKGSLVLVNAWAIAIDKKLWEDPLLFKPERFAKSKLDVKGQDFELIPFGAGRRICPGMSLALRTIPLVLGSMVNVFDWKLEGGIAPEEFDMGEKFHVTMHKAEPLRAVPIAL
ncbi:OLC1v1010062C2 [Oldenlandia corymbosa var. corymbosa]|uniref:OLC1v1010062C2 n=1 Tax=Oldenlandia corymbosa var. corymbosa TaxID=529605 RepID=A0AAV1DQE8_OLDCO|nr:OLC1v1010062C2 [Oldenlandia corymbosa var. corymbosa]